MGGNMQLAIFLFLLALGTLSKLGLASPVHMGSVNSNPYFTGERQWDISTGKHERKIIQEYLPVQSEEEKVFGEEHHPTPMKNRASALKEQDLTNTAQKNRLLMNEENIKELDLDQKIANMEAEEQQLTWRRKTRLQSYDEYQLRARSQTNTPIIALGTQFSILDGFNTQWLHDGTQSGSPFYPIENQNFITEISSTTEESPSTHFDDYVQLSFHTSYKDLLVEFLSMWTFDDENYKAADFSSQPNLATADESDASLLGIPSSYATATGKSFVLARLWKTIQTEKNVHLATSTTLQTEVSQASGPNDIINLFTKYGTHFLIEYTLGDCVYQVFAYDNTAFNEVLEQFPQTPDYLHGSNGYLFSLFTRERSTITGGGTIGYAEHVGQLLAVSKDSALESFRSQLQDTTYDVDESIFVFRKKFTLQDQMTTNVQIKLKFDSFKYRAVTGEEEQKRYTQTLMVAVFQKFGSATFVDFPDVNQPRFSSYMDAFNPNLVTNIATSYTAITRMNFNLRHLYILNPSFVTDLFIFADVVEADSEIVVNLPGTNTIHIICRKFVSHSSGNNVPKIVASTNIELISSSFFGVLHITEGENHYTIMDGTKFITVTSSRNPTIMTVSSDGSMLKLPTRSNFPDFYAGTTTYYEQWLTKSFTDAMELEGVSVQNILSIRASDESVTEAESSLEWIINTLSSDINDTDLSIDLGSVLTQALVIEKTREPAYLRNTLLVPRLAFPQYKTLYESMLDMVQSYETDLARVAGEISQRKQSQQQINTQTELNQNILATGKFLVEQVKAGTEHQTDIVTFHQRIDEMKNQDIASTETQAQNMLNELIAQQEAVKQTSDALESALQKYRLEQIFSAAIQVITVVGSLFSGGAAIKTLPEDARNIERVVKKIEFVFEVIKQMSDLYALGRELRQDVKKFNRAMSFFKRNTVDANDFPTALEWDDFDGDIDSYTLGVLPDQVGIEMRNFRQAAKKLSTRGRAYLNLQKKLQTIKYEKVMNELTRGVAERHEARLKELQTKFSPTSLTDYEANTANLFELGNILAIRANDVRAKLAQVFVTMDAALQYYYFQAPTAITGYDTLTLQSAATQQVLNSISALSSLPSKPHDLNDPISYDIPGVSVSALQSPEGFKQEIPLSATEFGSYVRVRIIEIEMKVDGVTSIPSGTVYLEAVASGELVQDRDFQRVRRTFASFPVNYRYSYDHSTGATVVGNRPSAHFIGKFMRMPPFVEWTFRIPDVDLNRGITFQGDTTTLRLKFYVNVVFQPTLVQIQQDITGSTEELLGKISGYSVLGDWDAVCAMDASKINDLWMQKYNYEVNNGGFLKFYQTGLEQTETTRSINTFTSLTMVIGPPKISFLPHNTDNVKMEMAASQISLYTKQVCTGASSRCAQGEIWDEYNDTLADSNAKVNAIFSMAKVEGQVDVEKKRILLDMTSAEAVAISVEGLSTQEQLAHQARMTEYFTSTLRSDPYELGTVDTSSLNTPASLQPDKFYLSTGGFKDSTDGLGTLYIFIKTSSSNSVATASTSRDFNIISKDDHIIPTGFTAALFVSSRVIFQDLVAPQVAEALGTTVEAEREGAGVESQRPYVVVGTGNMQITIYGSGGQSFPMSVSTSNFKVKASSSAVKLEWGSTSFDLEFSHSVWQCYAGAGGPPICGYENRKSTTTFSVSASESSSLSVDSASSTITFSPANLDVSVSYVKASTSEILFQNGLQKDSASRDVSNRIRDKLESINFSFKDISVFALTNLIFPRSKVIDISEVHLPGDMLILGNVVKDYDPNYYTAIDNS